jgi:hypothetical protein
MWPTLDRTTEKGDEKMTDIKSLEHKIDDVAYDVRQLKRDLHELNNAFLKAKRSLQEQICTMRKDIANLSAESQDYAEEET